MTKALVESRQQVIDRMAEASLAMPARGRAALPRGRSDEAEAKGANAIVAMRFDTSEMGDTWTEICAYGTAVRVRRA
jgi:uncharacterized protein YbjQ (UPF0145 family)